MEGQSIINNYSIWLSSKLQELKLDETVYADYITGVLEGEDSYEEKMETISSILSGSVQETVSHYCKEILDKWDSLLNNKIDAPKHEEKENVDLQFSRLLEENVRLEETPQNHQNHEYTEEQLKIRKAILSQYSHGDVVLDEFEEDDDDDGPSKMTGVEKNVNAATVQHAEKEKREKAKIENQQKKVKDKEDREKQKLTAQEKKDARRKKAQKVERHRF